MQMRYLAALHTDGVSSADGEGVYGDAPTLSTGEIPVRDRLPALRATSDQSATSRAFCRHLSAVLHEKRRPQWGAGGGEGRASGIREGREELEAAICLGAPSRQAAEPIVRQAFRAALMPTINTMAAMGIVSLPGMMTGQILSGTDPIVAVRYQIAIMCAITGAVGISSYLILLLGYRHYFTPAHQVREEES